MHSTYPNKIFEVKVKNGCLKAHKYKHYSNQQNKLIREISMVKFQDRGDFGR